VLRPETGETMLFRRLILSAVAVGVLAGILLSVGQQFTTVPIITAAETYEQPAAPAHDSHGTAHAHGAAHSHGHGDAESRGAAEGFQRAAFTVLADMGVAIGFGILLLVVMALARTTLGATMGPGTGALWGAAGFGAVFLAPALGLSPEVPGTAAAALESRQLWWITTVAIAAIALALLAFAPGYRKLGALVLLPLPYLFGAPEADGPLFAGHGPEAVEALEQLHLRFIVATGLLNAVFWVILGVACGWVMRRWIRVEPPASHATA